MTSVVEDAGPARKLLSSPAGAAPQTARPRPRRLRSPGPAGSRLPRLRACRTRLLSVRCAPHPRRTRGWTPGNPLLTRAGGRSQGLIKPQVGGVMMQGQLPTRGSQDVTEHMEEVGSICGLPAPHIPLRPPCRLRTQFPPALLCLVCAGRVAARAASEGRWGREQWPLDSAPSPSFRTSRAAGRGVHGPKEMGRDLEPPRFRGRPAGGSPAPRRRAGELLPPPRCVTGGGRGAAAGVRAGGGGARRGHIWRFRRRRGPTRNPGSHGPGSPVPPGRRA